MGGSGGEMNNQSVCWMCVWYWCNKEHCAHSRQFHKRITYTHQTTV